jgi:hypothetical protein
VWQRLDEQVARVLERVRRERSEHDVSLAQGGRHDGAGAPARPSL